MSLMQMQAVLRIIYAYEKVIGVDITCECSATLDYLSEVKDASVNNRANEELMQMILSEGWVGENQYSEILLINKYNIANLKKWAMLFIILRQLSK